MKNPAQRYVAHRNQGLSHKEATELSGFSFAKSISGALFWLAFFFFILVWLSMDSRDADRDAYVKNLEKTLATCLSSSAGKPVQIGDEFYMCGATPTGQKI